MSGAPAVPQDCWGWLTLAVDMPTVGSSIPLADGRTLTRLQVIEEAVRCDPTECAVWTALGNQLVGDDVAPTIRASDGRPANKLRAYSEAISAASKQDELKAAVTAMHNLALLLHDNDDEINIAFVDGVSVRNRLQLIVDAIALAPDVPELWTSAGFMCDASVDRVALNDGRQLTRLQLFLEALKLDLNSAVAYCGLASAMPDNGIAVVEGRRMTKKAVYLEAIRCNPQGWETYANLASLMQPFEVLTLTDRTTVTQKQLYAEALRCAPKPVPMLLVQLASTLGVDETIRTPAGSRSNRALLLQAIQMQPTLAVAFNNLACLLRTGETIDLPDGRSMDRRGLLEEALRHDPNNADAWFNTAMATPATAAKARRAAIDKALSSNPYHTGALLNLALSLKDASATTVLPNEATKATKSMLLVRAIRSDPQCATAYLHLASTLTDADATVVVHEAAPPFTRTVLLGEALRCEPSNGLIMAALAQSLSSPTQKLLLFDKRLVDKKTLYVEALRGKYESSNVYVNLGLMLEPGESVNLGLSRTNMTSKLLFVEAIRCDTNNSRAYFHLASDPSMTPRQAKGATEPRARPVVTLSDLRRMDAVGLYVEAIRLDATLAAAYNNLGVVIGNGGTVDLGGKRAGMTQRALFEEALRLDPGNEAARSNLYSLGSFSIPPSTPRP